MSHRLQKTIIHKYLDLINQDVSQEKEISELLNSINKLYKEGHLDNRDVFRQKIELIRNNLSNDLQKVQRKRVDKSIPLEISEDLRNVLKADLEGIDYSRTDLETLGEIGGKMELTMTKDDLIAILENLVIPKRKLTTEQDLEKFISDQLAAIFGKEKVHRQYSVGGFLALKTDIDVGNGQVGIEIKLSEKLTATDMQRMIGQVVYYKKRYYNENLIAFLVSRQMMNATISELKEFMEELGVTVVFNRAITI